MVDKRGKRMFEVNRKKRKVSDAGIEPATYRV